MERLLRAAKCTPSRKPNLRGRPGALEIQALHARLLGCVRRSTKASAGCSKYLDEAGWPTTRSSIYSSDQGFYLGEHGWFDKRWIFEESLRTPLLVRWPGVIKPGRVCRDMVSNLDFAETFSKPPECPSPTKCRAQVPTCVGGPNAGRLAEELLLPLLRVSGSAPCATALRGGDRPVQARPFLRTGHQLLGTIRPQTDPRELRSVYGEEKYKTTQQELAAELTRLRKDLKVPEVDPPTASGQRAAVTRQ